MKQPELSKEAHARHVARIQTLYPDERLVAFLSRSFGNTRPNAQLRALDIGFGAGRHLKLLLEFGFQTSGMEYQETALQVTRELFNTIEFSNLEELFIADFHDFQPARLFDVVVGWGLMVHSDYHRISEDLDKISSMMNEGGRMFVNFRTCDTWFYGMGEEVCEKTYQLDHRAGAYEGYIYSFIENIAELEKLIGASSLSLKAVERMDLWKNKLTERNSWFICELEKA